MSGIAGIISQSEWNTSSVFNMMLTKLKHRGPNDIGEYFDSKNHLRIGVQQLNIINGQCLPVFNKDKSLCIVFDGEIYNYEELKELCIKKRHQFYTKEEDEVIIHLYEEYGLSFLEYLQGTFALALWDSTNNSLILARDRFGQKPLVYFSRNKEFAFSSEIQSLIKYPGINKKISATAIHHYLTYSYIPAPLSIYEEVKKLLPAHYLVFRNGSITIKRYWSLSYIPKAKIEYEEAKELLYSKLNESIMLRMRGEKALGIFLSGGLDSSTVTALASQMKDNIRTYSIGFNIKKYDESQWAYIMSQKYGTNHTNITLDSSSLEILPQIVSYFGEPFGDYSSIPMYFLANSAKENISIALSGDGGDELFAGYTRFIKAYQGEKTRLPAAITRKLLSEVEQYPISQLEKISFCKKLLTSFCPNLHFADNRFSFRMRYLENELAKWSLYTPSMFEELSSVYSLDLLNTHFHKAFAYSFVDKLLYTDCNQYLSDDILTKVDICTMRHSIETRSPFLDYDLVELVSKFPFQFKIQNFDSRRIFKDTIKDIIPPEILNRPKQPFRIPIREWLNSSNWNIKEIILSNKSLSRGYFNPIALNSLIDKFYDGQPVHYQIWSLLILELWFQCNIDNN